MPRLSSPIAGGRVSGGARGPDGTRAPANTPAYSTAATTQVSTTAGLVSAVAALGTSAGGTVIEVTADLVGAVTLAANANSSSWSQNILIRPPLGTRKSTDSGVVLQCERVTFAGFNAAGARSLASRSGFWRCVTTTGATWQLTSDSAETCDDQFFVECAQPTWVFNTHYNLHLYAGGSSARTRRPLIDGCYLAPYVTGILLDATWDDGTGPYTNPGQPIDFYQSGVLPTIGSTFAVDTVVGAYDFGPPSGAIMLWTDSSDPTETAQTVELYIDGVLWKTVTLDQDVDRRHRKIRGSVDATVQRDWTDGQVITAKRTAGGSSARGLHIMYGVDAEDGPGATGPDFHAHNLQFFSSGGLVLDPTIRDTVLASADGKAIQLEATQGEMIVDNCFIGRISGGSAHSFGELDKTGRDHLREHVIDTDFQVAVTANQTATYPQFMRNRSPSFTSDHTLDASNTTHTPLYTTTLPDLAAIWPECPYTG